MSSNTRKISYDLTKPEFLKPQTRLEANRWLDKAQFGAATSYTDISASTKLNIVPEAGSVDDATKLMDIGYEAWVDEQLADDTMIPPNHTRQFGAVPVYTIPSNGSHSSGGASTGHPAYGIWFLVNALHGSSKLRLKSTFALSQIIALRQVGTTSEIYAVEDFIDVLYDATRSTGTSSFRKVLEGITYNWSMTKWLTYLYNQKEDPVNNRQPDENYAREILQLFSMGLVCLNMDGTPVLDAQGNPVPTYTAEDIPECARYFTGFTDPRTSSVSSFPEMNHTWHDMDAKTLFAYPGGSVVNVPARVNRAGINNFQKSIESGYAVTVIDANTFTVQTTPPNISYNGVVQQRDTYTNRPIAYYLDNTYLTPVLATATRGASETVTITSNSHGLTNGQIIFNKNPIELDIDIMLDHIFNHPTTPPYMAKSLIKFFVTSNPTPQYVRRVAEVFVNNGSGVRGDIAAVIKAILLDREAIIPYGVNPNNHGRLLNPLERVLKVVNAFRSDNVTIVADDDLVNRNQAHIDNGVFCNKPRHLRHWESFQSAWNSGQMQFMNTPSVFNFYRPGYVPPATTLGELGLTAPESQVINTEAEIVWLNAVDSLCNYTSMSVDLSTAFPGFVAYNTEAALDPRNAKGRWQGLTFEKSTFTVTAKTDTTLTLDGTIPLPSSGIGQIWINRTNNFMIGNPYGTGATFATITAGAGAKTITLTGLTLAQTNNFTVGDIVDAPPCCAIPPNNFPTSYRITSGGQPTIADGPAYCILFYKAALTLPDEVANPSQAQIDVAINYLESILMSRPISANLRAIMSNLATQPVTLPGNLVTTTDPTMINHYRNFRWSHRQVRIRRMINALLVSPEFLVQY